MNFVKPVLCNACVFKDMDLHGVQALQNLNGNNQNYSLSIREPNKVVYKRENGNNQHTIKCLLVKWN